MEESEMTLVDCIAFLASSIRCGTNWTPDVERIYQMALNYARIKQEAECPTCQS